MLRFILIALVALPAAWPQDAVAPSRKIALFNGKDLEGWYVFLRETRYADPKKVFSVENGAIRISGEDWGGVATRQSYRDYHLLVEWRWGPRTWGNREGKARDSGILVHGVGEDGAAGGQWLESIESQVIEGGTGDIIPVSGKNRPSLTATVRQDGRQTYWDRDGAPATRDGVRINWWGRSPDWKDVFGFRGPRDVESPAGEWNRHEIFAGGDTFACVLNGKLVSRAYNLSHRAGKIQIQSEGAEIFIRKVELQPAAAAAPPER